MVRHPGAPGSRGLACSVSRALSRITMSLRDAARRMEQGAALLGRGGDVGTGEAEPAQEHTEGGARVQRLARVLEAAQVHVELAVGEPLGHLVRPVHGEGRLADSRPFRRSRR